MKSILGIRRCISSSKGISPLYEAMRAKDNNVYKEMSPIEIIKQEGEKVDLPSYDLLFDRFLSGDWGRKENRPRSPIQVSQKVIEFMTATKDLGFALTKEQLCKLVIDYYGEELIHVTPPY